MIAKLIAVASAHARQQMTLPIGYKAYFGCSLLWLLNFLIKIKLISIQIQNREWSLYNDQSMPIF